MDNPQVQRPITTIADSHQGLVNVRRDASQIPPIKSASPHRNINGNIVFYYLIIIIFFVAILSLSGADTMSQQAVTYIGLWSGVSLGFTLLAGKLTFSARTGRPLDLFEIPVVLTVMNLALNSLAGIGVFIDPGKYLSNLLPSVIYVHYALLLTSFGLLFLWIGYGFAIVLWRLPRNNNKKRHHPRPWDFSNPALNRTIIVYTILLLIRVILSIIGAGERNAGVSITSNEWTQWITYLISGRYYLYALIAIQAFRRSWPLWILVSATIIESIMIFISGSSGEHIGTIYLLTGIMILFGMRIPWKLLIVAAVAAVFIVPVTRSTRDILRGDPRQINDVVAVYTDNVVETLTYYIQNPKDALNFIIAFYFERQGGVAQIPGIVLARVPSQVPYLPAQDLLTVPFSFIPRAFWPGEKPEWGRFGGYFTTVILDNPENQSSAAPTLIGSAYLYGGLPIVAIGMFFLGILAAALYQLFAVRGIRNAQVGLLAVYLGIVQYNFVFGGGAIIGVWQGVTQTAIVYFVVAFILCVDTKPNAFHTRLQASQNTGYGEGAN